MAVTFKQRSSAKRTSSGNGTVTLAYHSSASAGDLQILLVTDHVTNEGFPSTYNYGITGSGWVQVFNRSMSETAMRVWARYLQTADVSSNVSLTASDYTNIELRTYGVTNGEWPYISHYGDGYTSSAETIDTFLLRCWGLGRDNNQYVGVTGGGTLNLPSGLLNGANCSWSWYDAGTFGDDPGAAGASVGPYTATSTSDPLWKQWLNLMIAPVGANTFRVFNLRKVEGNNYAYVAWDILGGATSYDWSIDGGTTINSTTSPWINLTGLTSGTTYTVQVRPITTNTSAPVSTGNWQNISVTPSINNHTVTFGHVSYYDWVKNGTVFYTPGDEVALTYGNGSASSTVISQATIPISGNWYGELSVSGYVGDGADTFQIGFINGTDSVNTVVNDAGIQGNANFYGVSLNVWSTEAVWAWFGSSQQASNMTVNDGSYKTYTIRYSVSGTTLTMTLFKEGTQLASFSGTAPSFTSIRPLVAARTGGSSAVFKVRSQPYWSDGALSTPTAPVVYTDDGQLAVKWSKMTGATSYDYSLDGGATYTNTTNNYVYLTGLTNGVSYSVQIRARNAAGASDWSSATSQTPNTLPPYQSQVIRDNPIFYASLNETSGNFNDAWANNLVFTPLTPTYSHPPIVNDSGTSSSSISGGIGIAETSVLSSMNTSTFSLEAWIKLPTTSQIQGVVTHVGSTGGNGYGISIGGSNGENLGRTIFLLLDGINWYSFGYSLPTYTDTFHVVITRNASAYILYVNGVQVGTASTSSFNTPSGFVRIGGSNNNVNRLLSSVVDVDSVALYPSTLTAARIQAHFLTGVILQTPLPISYSTNGGVFTRWPAVLGAESYDRTSDGGTTITNQLPATTTPYIATANYLTISGTNGTPQSIQVRAKNSYQPNPTSWSALSTQTPSAAKYLILADNFDRPAITGMTGTPQYSSTGSSYTAVAGAWGIDTAGRLYSSSVASPALFLTQGERNVDIRWNPSAFGSNSFGPVFRYVDANNYWFCYIENGASNTLRVWHRHLSTDIQAYISPYTGNTTDLLRVVAKNKWIYFYQNGNLVAQVEDMYWNLTGNTQIGWRFYNSTSYRVDNTLVYSVAPNEDFSAGIAGPVHIYKGHDTYDEDIGGIP